MRSGNDDAVVHSREAVDAVTAAVFLTYRADGRVGQTPQLNVGIVHGGPTDPTIASLLTDADRLILVGQVEAAVVVVRLYDGVGRAEIVLGAAFRRQQLRVAVVLSDFDGPLSGHGGRSRSDLKSQAVALR